MKCRNLDAVGGVEGVRKTAVCIFEISIVLNPQFSGALSQGFSFWISCHKKSAHYFSLSGSCQCSFFPQQTVLHSKNDHFHSTLWTVLISSSLRVFSVDQKEVMKKSSNNSRSAVREGSLKKMSLCFYWNAGPFGIKWKGNKYCTLNADIAILTPFNQYTLLQIQTL